MRENFGARMGKVGGMMNPAEMDNIGVNEAPNLNPKMFVNPDPMNRGVGAVGGAGDMKGMPIGGASVQQQQPPQQGGLPQVPQQQPPQPEGNMLQMTPQGRAMGAMQPPMGQQQRMAKGGTADIANEAIAKASGKKHVPAKDLTTMQDFHTSLGDQVRKRANDMKDMMDKMDFKYDKGHRVFTEHSLKHNKLPYEVLSRTLYGNHVMREPHPENPLMGKIIRDPQTNKAMRTPYVPGYRLRQDHGNGEYSMFDLPQSAIKGSVDDEGYKNGGKVKTKSSLPVKSVDIMRIEIMKKKGKK